MTTSDRTDDQSTGEPTTNGAPDPAVPTDGPLVLLGAVWGESGCRLRLRRPGEPSMLVPAVGLELRYRVPDGQPRHCIGHRSPKRNDGNHLDCDTPPQEGQATCVRCAVADAEFAADLHHAHTRPRNELDPAVLQHLRRPNVLYVAAFRDGSLKIGTSTATRRDVRLAEQGAWRAVEVAEVADGFAVRRLEDLVTRELGLTQAVATSRKLKGMVAPRPDRDLDRAIDDATTAVNELLDGPEGSQLGSANPTGIRWSNPGADEPWWRRVLRYPSPIDVGAHRVRIEAMCGRLAALSRPGTERADGTDVFVDDLGKLWGRELSLGEVEPDQLLVQDTLF
ncbi:MAG: DUF2797 domain-containing protein [Actinomycetota bacterium]